jgi:GlcNAc-P-P-Und epimerase
MKVLVTGAAGLIGKWLVRTLAANGAVVVGLDRASQPGGLCFHEYYRCDILDSAKLSQILRQTCPEAIVHLAARTDLEETKSLEGYSANTQGVINLIQAIRGASGVKRAIFTSSQLVCRVGYLPRTMEDYCPSTLYGQSKVLTEQIVRESDGGVREWCLVRPTTVWGPFMSSHYQRMLRAIKKGRYFHVGTAKLLKSYSYAGNIAWQYRQILQSAAELIHRQTLYLADYEPLSLREYADELARSMGSPRIRTVPLWVARLLARGGDLLNAAGWRSFPFNTFRLNNILTEYVFDLHSTEQICGTLPFNWREGVRETTKWFLGLAEEESHSRPVHPPAENLRHSRTRK